ncbi:hypothetical protein [Azorhizobium sp. AG788]|uniref:hypothetical protein n=1 Tax=Azorhizobium sp. AG788 TaxID=2183897 RepID=UPI003138C20D
MSPLAYEAGRMAAQVDGLDGGACTAVQVTALVVATIVLALAVRATTGTRRPTYRHPGDAA